MGVKIKFTKKNKKKGMNNDERKSEKRRQQGSNLRGRSPTDFKSVSLTTRTYRRLLVNSSFNKLNNNT